MFKVFWRLGPRKYSESFLLTVNRKHIQGHVLSSNSVFIHDVYFNPYVNGKIRTADGQPNQTTKIFYSYD